VAGALVRLVVAATGSSADASMALMTAPPASSWWAVLRPSRARASFACCLRTPSCPSPCRPPSAP